MQTYTIEEQSIVTLTFTQALSTATVGAVLFWCTAEPVRAATVTNGFTFSVANDFELNVGTHFHSNSGGAFGNPPGKAEVGNFFTEEVRGLSEYDLTGLSSATSASISFDIFQNGGLFAFDNDFPFVGNIDVVAYGGNNAEDLSDYQAATLGTVGTFNTAGLSVGDTLNFDLTSIFNDAIAAPLSSLGIRLQIASGTDPMGGAWTFDNFRLTTDDVTPTPVPEPGSASRLLALVAISTGLMLKRKRFEAYNNQSSFNR